LKQIHVYFKWIFADPTIQLFLKGLVSEKQNHQTIKKFIHLI